VAWGIVRQRHFTQLLHQLPELKRGSTFRVCRMCPKTLTQKPIPRVQNVAGAGEVASVQVRGSGGWQYMSHTWGGVFEMSSMPQGFRWSFIITTANGQSVSPPNHGCLSVCLSIGHASRATSGHGSRAPTSFQYSGYSPTTSQSCMV
jgi:Expansin C-terminal domain